MFEILSLTFDVPEAKRKAIVIQSALTALIVSIVFVTVGIELIKPSRQMNGSDKPIGIVPIGVPLIVGPAVLTTLRVLMDHYGVIPTFISLFEGLTQQPLGN